MADKDLFGYVYANVGVIVPLPDKSFGYVYSDVGTLVQDGPRQGATKTCYIAGHSFTGGTLDALGLF